MKKLLLIVLAAGIFVSCSKPSQEEVLIASFEQTLGNTKIDLQFEALETKHIGQIMAADSLKFYKDYLDQKAAEKRQWFKDFRKDDPELEQWIERYSTDFAGTFLEPTYWKVKEFEELSDAKIADIYECRYKIKNPVLNNMEQEITSKYLISPDKSKIIKQLED
jgi:hypothetical protein